jgi:hypothetical protein
MIPKPSLLVKVKFSKSAGILQYFAFYGLAWSDIQILIPDLESPWNCAPDDTQIIQFGEGQFYKSTLIICLFRLSLCRYSNSDTRSGISSKFRFRWYPNHLIWWHCLFWSSLKHSGTLSPLWELRHSYILPNLVPNHHHI